MRLESELGHRFRDRGLLDRALTHPSARNETRGPDVGTYERLEFLGDALLGFLAADALFREHGEASEGELTRRRQALVRRQTLADAARRLDLASWARCGRGESEGPVRDGLLADLFESVLAAVYLDAGIRAARAFFRRHLGPHDAIRSAAVPRGGDHKTRLQELVQGRLRDTPGYRIVSTCGPPHDRTFTAVVFLGDRILGTGSGSSRKDAEQRAAEKALACLEPSGE